MRFLRVEIRNFLSFGDVEQTVPLDRKGLFGVFGENKEALGADSNGAGKSSIPEAIVWALYGETMRGYKADDVVNRGTGKNCRVALHIEDDGKTYAVVRTRKFVAKRSNDLELFVNGTSASQGINVDTQQLVQTVIGMDMTTFTQAVMLSHGTRPFSVMTDKEQKQVFDDIMQTGVVVNAREKVKERITKRQQALIGVQTTVEGLATRITGFEHQLSKLIVERDAHAVVLKQRRLELLSRKAEVEGRIEEIYVQTGLDKLLALEETLTKEIEGHNKVLLSLANEVLILGQTFRNKLVAVASEEGSFRGRLSQLQSDLSAVNRLVGKPCPTCRQTLAPDAADACMTAWAAEKHNVELALQVLQDRKAEIAASENEALKGFRESSQDHEAKKRQLMVHQREISERVSKRSVVLQQITSLEQTAFNYQTEIDALDESSNPYRAMVDQTKSDIDGLKRLHRFYAYQVRAIQLELAHLSYWMQGFGNQGLKSYVLDSVVPFLTERAQRYADILSGGDLKIEFKTQTQLKSGEWREQFQVKVTNRQGADVYEGNSSGEKSRIDIAVGWALGDLAATRAKKPIRFKGLDEPFENLDETGEDSVIRLLNSVLGQYETIMCITHSSHLRNQFPSDITVIKEGGMSRIVT